MTKLTAKIRKETGRNYEKGDFIPAVLYGPKVENLSLEVEKKIIQKTYQAKSSLCIKI